MIMFNLSALRAPLLKTGEEWRFECWGFRVKPGMTYVVRNAPTVLNSASSITVIPGLTRNPQH